MNKKELKQRIAEVFGDVNIRYKSQYIRDLIEEEVSEELTVVRTETLNYLRRKIETINERQINGYETFKNVEENQKVFIKELSSIKLTLVIVSICYLGIALIK